jgi:hypothetical protein
MALPTETTSPGAERHQIELLRRAGPVRRFALARSLTITTIELAREAIRRRNTQFSEREVELEFVRVHYGSELAQAVRRHLASRGP